MTAGLVYTQVLMRLLIHSFVRVVSFVCNRLVHMAVIELMVSSTTVTACYICNSHADITPWRWRQQWWQAGFL